MTQAIKRVTPEEDIERLQERVWARGRGKIKNKADFLSVYDGYMRDSGQRKDTKLQDAVFKKMQRRHKGVSGSIATKRERINVFRQAGNKPSPKEFNTLGKQKGKTVYARRTVVKFVKIPRQAIVYRDTKGRFVSVSER